MGCVASVNLPRKNSSKICKKGTSQIGSVTLRCQINVPQLINFLLFPTPGPFSNPIFSVWCLRRMVCGWWRKCANRFANSYCATLNNNNNKNAAAKHVMASQILRVYHSIKTPFSTMALPKLQSWTRPRYYLLFIY